ncbi:MAG TPA: hypothetical protein VEL07_21790 [Planctomycetota bacterium]|nr:hypothetical protein [Planctomycetota bacterium]
MRIRLFAAAILLTSSAVLGAGCRGPKHLPGPHVSASPGHLAPPPGHVKQALR